MAKAFDITLNSLIDAHLADWAGFLTARAGLPLGPARPLDSDLPAALQADRLFHVGSPIPFALHLELESTGRLGVPDRLLRYNVAARGATGLPVHTVLVLLRPKAAATDQTGVLELTGAADRPYLTFRYAVVRVWEESVEGLLAAGPGLVPLALLTDEAAADLDRAFDRFHDRLRRPDFAGMVADDLLGATFILSGLRYDRERVAALYQRLSMTLEDSSTYQWILAKGEAKGEAKGKAEGETRGAATEARKLVLRLGARRFGPPPAAALDGVADLDRLERIADRTLDAADWDDLLATP